MTIGRDRTSSGPQMILRCRTGPRAGALQRAIDVFTQGPPPTHQGLVRRDFHPGNILWEGDRITGVIDWAETSWGPPDLDVMHSRANFAMLHDVDSAVAFSNACRWHGGALDDDHARKRLSVTKSSVNSGWPPCQGRLG
jgi:Phosphotransferase enzyme family